MEIFIMFFNVRLIFCIVGCHNAGVFISCFPSLCLVGEDGSYDNQVLVCEVGVAEVLDRPVPQDGADPRVKAGLLVGEEPLDEAARLVGAA